VGLFLSRLVFVADRVGNYIGAEFRYLRGLGSLASTIGRIFQERGSAVAIDFASGKGSYLPFARQDKSEFPISHWISSAMKPSGLTGLGGVAGMSFEISLPSYGAGQGSQNLLYSEVGVLQTAVKIAINHLATRGIPKEDKPVAYNLNRYTLGDKIQLVISRTGETTAKALFLVRQ
jgi:hypothetical protein